MDKEEDIQPQPHQLHKQKKSGEVYKSKWVEMVKKKKNPI